MSPIRHALRTTATVALAIVGLALVLFAPGTSHMKIGDMSLGGGVARADVPACGGGGGGDSDASGGGTGACADSDGDCS